MIYSTMESENKRA